MTKEQLYTAIENVNSRGVTIANMIRNVEATYTGNDLTAKLEEIKFMEVNNLLVGDYKAKENVITLCDMIDENG